MIKKGKRNPVVALSGMLHVSVKARPQQKINSSQLLWNSFPLLNITKVTCERFAEMIFLRVTVGTCTSLKKNFLLYSNRHTYWHLRFLQTFVSGLIGKRCLKFSTANTTHEIPPVHSRHRLHEERRAASHTTSEVLPLHQPEGISRLGFPSEDIQVG